MSGALAPGHPRSPPKAIIFGPDCQVQMTGTASTGVVPAQYKGAARHPISSSRQTAATA